VNNTLDRTIFDAIPIPVFVVDDDVRILDLNGSANQFCAELRQSKEFVASQLLQRKSGEVLTCIYSATVPGGCGKGPACKACVIRNSVNTSLTGQTISRKRTKMRVGQGEKTHELHILVTACPVPQPGAGRALLMLEDITPLATLKNLIPICMKCKSVREDEEYWQTLESYVHDHMGVDFSHGVCPNCANDFYPEYRRKELPEATKL
jgi:PAS domain-containing protein